MRNEDLLKCPLLRGLDPIRRAELLGLLNDSKLGEDLEKCLATHAADASDCSDAEPEVKAAVHAWRPNLPQGRRSSKE
jgi:hypothetical protein